MKPSFFLLIPLFFICTVLTAQDPTRFSQEIEAFNADTSTYQQQDVVVFTGSSSIRTWYKLPEYFPNYIVLNRGFGGSQMSDLYHYKEELILKYRPKQVFIYEGDNDIANGKSTRRILKDTRKLVRYLTKQQPDIQLVFISAKPSISRWHLKKQYEKWNAKLKKYCNKKSNLTYVDIWNPMLNDDGTLNKTIFVADGLHLNPQGYIIWADAIRPFLYQK